MSIKANPLVSVLIPAYNHENYVQGTIRSIIDQTYQNIELIIIDDGSKDTTLAKIHELDAECHKRFAKFVVKTQDNSGTCITLNRLLAEASGQYVYFIASDDQAKPQCIQTELEFLQAHPDYCLAVGDNDFIDEHGQAMYLDEEKKGTYDEATAKFKTFGQLISHNAKFDIYCKKFGRYDILHNGNHIPNGYLIRKSAVDEVPPFTPKAPLEDWYLMLQLAKHSKMKLLNGILFSYRKHSTNTSGNLEHMKEMSAKTRVYEDKQLSESDDSKITRWALYTKKGYGICYRESGIPGVLEILTFNDVGNKIKTKIIRVLNCEICKYRYRYQK